MGGSRVRATLTFRNLICVDLAHVDLHSLWDSLLIAKALRETPRKYNLPLPSQQIESVLRGTIYDSYIRRIMWEGVLNEWSDEIPSWVSCPASSASTEPNAVWQQVLISLRRFAAGPAPGEDTDDDVLCPFYWAQPIHKLNCDLIWPKELDEPPYKHDSRAYTSVPHEHHGRVGVHGAVALNEEGVSPRPIYLELDTPEYAGEIKERLIVEKLLAQAGIRLAAVVNWLFADLEEGNNRLAVLTV